ncbi:15646_t:CDS:2 [Cetraspora pellucida]|uniref:15646_t:CDS:1 n=1 Tax=Cetraspora pellucida TaxID=1433469 RepID=A0A9N9E8Y4_9GLOM|nr:15646_t:CDS:2 [Cetraspora pellucida]
MSEDTTEDEISSYEEPEFVQSYKLFIKLSDRNLLPTKWFEELVSTIDEFFSSIYDKVIMLTKDTNILPNNYCVTFKLQREAGAGTQLVDAQDFKKFKVEYSKLAARQNNIEIYITIAQSYISQKRKKKASDMNKELATIESSPTYPLFSHSKISSKKFSQVTPSQEKASLISLLPKMQASPPQTIISLLSHLQVQAPTVLPSLQIQAPLVLLTQQIHLLLVLSPSQPPLSSNLYNPYQALSLHTQTIQPNLYISFTLPTMAEFLGEIDEKEKTDYYYQTFLEKFEEQRILVKHLQKLMNEELEQCGINIIGAWQTLHKYAEKYQMPNRSNFC